MRLINKLHHLELNPHVDEAERKRRRAELQALGMWLEPAVFNKMSFAEKKAHFDKLHAMRKAKKATTNSSSSNVPEPALVNSPPAPVNSPPEQIPVVPQTFAQAATTQPQQTPEQLQMVQAVQTRYPNGPPAVFSYGGRVYRGFNAIRTYKVNGPGAPIGSLVDGGCNGVLAGADVLILDEHSFGTVDIVGVADNLIKDVPLCTAVAMVETVQGPILAFMHNYAALQTGTSIHSPTQMRDHGILIDDTPKTQKRFDGEFGTQSMVIPAMDGNSSFNVELTIAGGLPYFKQRPPTDAELNDITIPHVHLTSGMPWNPSKYDDDKEKMEIAVPFQPLGAVAVVDFNAPMSVGTDDEADNEDDKSLAELCIPDDDSDVESSIGVDANAFLRELAFCKSSVHEHECTVDSMFGDTFNAIPNVIEAIASVARSTTAKLTHVEHKYGKTLEQLRPHFAWASVDTIKKTLDASTQMYRATEWARKIKRHFKSRFPGANVERINEVVSLDPHYMDVKGAADGITGHGGAIAFQLFVGNESKHITVYPIQKESQFPNVLQDYVRTKGAPKKLFTDNAKTELSKAAKAVLRAFGIDDASSEPYYQNQNAAEREIQDVVKDMELVMNVTNTPASLWPLCVEYIAMVKTTQRGIPSVIEHQWNDERARHLMCQSSCRFGGMNPSITWIVRARNSLDAGRALPNMSAMN